MGSMQACRIFSIAGFVLMIAFGIGHMMWHNPLDRFFIAPLICVAAIIITSLGLMYRRTWKLSKVRQ